MLKAGLPKDMAGGSAFYRADSPCLPRECIPLTPLYMSTQIPSPCAISGGDQAFFSFFTRLWFTLLYQLCVGEHKLFWRDTVMSNILKAQTWHSPTSSWPSDTFPEVLPGNSPLPWGNTLGICWFPLDLPVFFPLPPLGL